jgi:hypothetical protein
VRFRHWLVCYLISFFLDWQKDCSSRLTQHKHMLSWHYLSSNHVYITEWYQLLSSDAQMQSSQEFPIISFPRTLPFMGNKNTHKNQPLAPRYNPSYQQTGTSRKNSCCVNPAQANSLIQSALFLTDPFVPNSVSEFIKVVVKDKIHAALTQVAKLHDGLSQRLISRSRKIKQVDMSTFDRIVTIPVAAWF